MKNFKVFIQEKIIEAGRMSLDGFWKEQKISWKKGGSPVSKTDIKVNKYLVSEIKNSFPNHNIISEELPEVKKESSFTWFIDPIDGTINFVQGIPYFGISVGLAKGSEMIMGAVYDPVHKELYFAEKNKGAHLNGQLIKSKARDDLSKALIDLEIWSKAKYKLDKFEFELSKKIWVVAKRQCLVLSACYAALGRMDGFIFAHNTPWDVAAIDLICREAGLVTSQMDSKPWYPGRKMKGYLCAKEGVHKKLLKLIKPYLG